jgi:EmrB/QacA subfamily drug resistance transporter
VVLVYLLVLTSTILLFGKLGDRLGLIRVFKAGFVLFTLGSLLCGLSRSLPMLLGARCLQALGGAMLYAITPGIIPRYLPAAQRGLAFGILSTSAALGLSVGAPLGGLITAHLSWRWVFLINIPFGILAIYVARKVFPPEPRRRAAEAPEPFDFIGAVLNFAGLCALLYALNMGQERGWTSPVIGACLAAALLLLAGFVFWERRCRHPLLDGVLFRIRSFNAANGANLLAFMFLAGAGFLLPFYLIHFRDLRSDQAGLFMLLLSVTMMIVGPLAGRLSDRLAPRWFCLAGMASAAAASFGFAFGLGRPGLGIVAVCLAWMGCSLGLFFSPNNSQVMSWADSNRQGIASGILKMTANLGQVLGVCLFETVFSQSVPAGQAAAASLRPGAAAGLPTGFRNAFIVGGLVCLLALGMAALARDRRPPAGAAEPDGLPL